MFGICLIILFPKNELKALYDICTFSEGQRFCPTSPLRDYTGTPGRRKRSQSAGVRFKDASMTGEDVRRRDKKLPISATCYFV